MLNLNRIFCSSLLFACLPITRGIFHSGIGFGCISENLSTFILGKGIRCVDFPNRKHTAGPLGVMLTEPIHYLNGQ